MPQFDKGYRIPLVSRIHDLTYSLFSPIHQFLGFLIEFLSQRLMKTIEAVEMSIIFIPVPFWMLEPKLNSVHPGFIPFKLLNLEPMRWDLIKRYEDTCRIWAWQTLKASRDREWNTVCTEDRSQIVTFHIPFKRLANKMRPYKNVMETHAIYEHNKP